MNNRRKTMAAPNPHSRNSSFTAIGSLVTMFGLMSGCQLVFGDFEFAPDPGTGGTAGAEPCDNPGAKRCNPNVGQPQLCQDGIWKSNGSPCTEPKLCNVNKGICDSCYSGTQRCASNNVSIETCQQSGEGWDVQSCTGSQVCDSQRFVCVACQANRGTCGPDGSSIYRCNKDLTAFETVASRCSADLPCVVVDGRSDYCAGCDPGSATDAPKCLNPGVLLTCESDRQWHTSKCDQESCVPATSTRAASCAQAR